jgi:hypothetical protein
MASTSKRLLWLTALTTASLAVTGCGGTPSRSPAAPVAATPNPSPTHRAPSAPPTPTPSPVDGAPGSATPSPVVQVDAPAQRFVLVTSDGSSTIRVSGRPVRFPGPVTDATVSPNGLDLAFVDGQGNIALARLDGTAVRVLTATDPAVRRAQPTFEDGGAEIVFTERGHDGVWRLKEVAVDGHDDLTDAELDPTVPETASDGGHDTTPSATWFQASHNEGARSVLLFEHRTPSGVLKVYVADRNQRGFGSYPLLPGRAPAVSPTGDRVAFIGAHGQIDVQSLPVPGRRPHPTQITWGAHPTGHLGWSPDGRQLVFSTRHDVQTVASTPIRRGDNPVRVVLDHPGVGSMGTVARPTVGVYAGSDPVTTAVAVSRAHYVDGPHLAMDDSDGFGLAAANNVILVGADDSSAAAPAIAMAGGGPILFVQGETLDPAVREEIVRLLKRPRGLHTHGTVDIVGSTSAVPESVAAEVAKLGFRVRRFDPEAAATDATAMRPGWNPEYVVVSADDLPALASSVGTTDPVLLTDGSAMPAATAAKLDRSHQEHGPLTTVYAVGEQAQAAVRSSWPGKRPLHVVDLGGSDPFANSLAAVQGLYDAPHRLAVAAVADWKDMVIASMVGPTLVVDERHGLEDAARTWLSSSQAAMRAVYVFGGSATLPASVGHAVYGDRYVVRRAPEDVAG